MSDDIIKNTRRGQSRITMDIRPQYQQLNIEPISVVNNPAHSHYKYPTPQDTTIIVDMEKTRLNPPEYDPESAQKIIEQYQQKQQPSEEELVPEIGEYLLLVQGKVISHGNLDKIENEIEKIIYGDNELISNIDIHEDLVVLKRIPIKIGVHIKE